MTLKSFLYKFFLGGKVIDKINSPINGEIKIIEDFFSRKEMVVDGICQSGGLVERLWKVALSTVQSSKFKVQSCLILGLGCGDAARLINEVWPKAQITGVEVDQKVVEIGKKYFGLGEVLNLEIFVADAIKFVDTKYKIPNTRYNLILVDLYLGKDYPKEAESKEFLNGLKNVLNKDGLVIINRLYYTSSFKKDAESFLKKVKEIFSNVETKKAVTNLLIFASN
ncbi:hypothetical protein COT03_02535 [Candidatus Shapirobacteria bacterium CG07_land_8_20_14_0_80_39_18]|uniref:PABS domain-containing protein n=1 Tax=Candidatus Shapirobacteria bacterium CG07_land_8_20_14_0_80_39_18 TaxID=1974882 RepID=A0A2M6YQY4_9BACT|nr:MAG: hypothetical protein COT03_02535 [Candidatus Shapirobacteria bacterium CG07_land_8_20_14_0_80_39_18]